MSRLQETLTQKEYEKALGILGERERHLHSRHKRETAALQVKLRQATADPKKAW